MSVLVAKDSNICICCSNKYTVKRDYCEWKAGGNSKVQMDNCLYYDEEHKLDYILGILNP